MNLPIDPNVKIDPADTRDHIGVTCFPVAFDTIRFSPLTDKGRKILKLRSGQTIVTAGLNRAYQIYDAIVASGYSVKQEILADTAQPSKWEQTARSLQSE